MSNYEIDITDQIEGAKEANLLVKLVQDNDCTDDPTDMDMSAGFWTFERDRCSRPGVGSEFSFEGPEDFSGWAEFRAAMEKEVPGIVIMPIYRYSHSGTIYSTAPFSCPWDSGQVGWVYATPAMLKEWHGDSPYTREQIEESLTGEVETYSQWQSGDCWGYTIERCTYDEYGDYDDTGEELDSCWGFIGEKWATEAATDAAKPYVVEEQLIAIS